MSWSTFEDRSLEETPASRTGIVATTPEQILDAVEHRPFPLPRSEWVMTQEWLDLLFAHWPVPAGVLRSVVPPQLSLDLFEGEAWIGVVPFRMRDIRLRNWPVLPGFRALPELNVRTYVVYNGLPGVYFFSLDAASLPAVWGARLWYGLPYFWANMKVESRSDSIAYHSLRKPAIGVPKAAPAEFVGHYWPSGKVSPAAFGTLEYWLTERYCLYTVRENEVLRAHVHHLEWPLQAAEAEIQRNSMASAIGVALPAARPVLHFSKRQKVLVWPPIPANSDDA